MEWLSFGLSALCAIGSFIGFILAQREKKEAKKSEIAAKEYAENANKAYVEIQKHVGYLNADYEQQVLYNKEKDKVKQHIISIYRDSGTMLSGIDNIIEDVYQNQCDKHDVLCILRELEKDGLIHQLKLDGAYDFQGFVIDRDF